MARKRPESELVRALHQSPALPYRQCDWVADGQQCRYPWGISSNPGPGGPYYCRLHFGCEDPVFGAQVVEASRDYKHPTLEETLAVHTARAKRSIAKLGLDRKPDESIKDYMARTKEWMKGKKVGKQMKRGKAA